MSAYPFNRTGTTVMEMILALGIFVTVVVGITQGLIATRSYVGEDEIRADFELESARLLNEFTKDLANATWFGVPPSSAPSTNEDNPYAATPLTYPNVGRNVPGRRWGDQLDFVKLRLSDDIVLRPGDGRQTTVRVDDPLNPPVELDEFLDAKAMTTMIANPSWLPGSDDDFLMPVFDAPVTGLTFEENRQFTAPNRSPRLWRYIVRESPSTGRGQLVRQYSNGPGTDYAAIPSHPTTLNDTSVVTPPALASTPNPWIDDAILSDNVKAIDDPLLLPGTPGLTFDTFTTDPTLGQYQIRIRVILIRQPPGTGSGERIYRTLQATVAMRSN
jgi:hypothetical protein